MKKIFLILLLSLLILALLGCDEGETNDTETAAENETASSDGVIIPDKDAENENLRRPVTPDHPMWIVHIDTWNTPDPEKIIELIPEKIRPYVVFNISMSISNTEDTHEWNIVYNGYETAKSWIRACAEKGVWVLVQPASGGPCHFPDYDPAKTDYEETLYAEFFRDYPNFLGFNYCEQFWGFEQPGFTGTPEERWLHFAGLLELTHKYGGYLVVSWCGNEWSPAINPLAMLKKVPEWEKAAREYGDNFILCEKYTQTSYLADMESIVLGYYLSGYSGNFGVRYDETGWTEGTKGDYTMSTGLAVQLERMFLNGATVIDGPELVMFDDFKEISETTDSEGYKSRAWDSFTVFDNVAVDMFDKVVDGTLRIPTREEVIKRTKIAIIHDVNMGSNDDIYSIPETLTVDLYRAEGDGNLKSNFNFYKPTGRYPAIPVVYGFADDELEYAFDLLLHNSKLSKYWPKLDDKVTMYDGFFKSEYEGDLYVGRYENTLVVYNPYKAEKEASAKIPLLYNTADALSLNLSRYSSGVIKETGEEIAVYINNYDDNSHAKKRTDVISISGLTEEPTYTANDRVKAQVKSEISAEYKDGVYTLTVKHNGPLDIVIKAVGAGENKITSYTPVTLNAPDAPPVYEGELQHEAEVFDYKGISGIVKNGCHMGVEDFTAQGYMKFGKSKSAAVKDTFLIKTAGEYTLTLRYSADADTGDLMLYVNGEAVGKFDIHKTESYSDWQEASLGVNFTEGENKIEIKAENKLDGTLYFDNITVNKN